MKVKLATLVAILVTAASPLFAISGEFSATGGWNMMSGYGVSFHETVDTAARYAAVDDVKLKQPSFSGGVEGTVLQTLYTNKRVRISMVGTYSLKFDDESFSIYHKYVDVLAVPDWWLPAWGPGTPVLSTDYPDDVERTTDSYNLKAVTNRLMFGGRSTFQTIPLYIQLTGGVLFYNPLYMRATFGFDGKTHSVWGAQTKKVRISSDPKLGYQQDFSLGGTAETMAALEVRVGYGPIFTAFEYVTNWRVSNASVQVGAILYPWGGF